MARRLIAAGLLVSLMYLIVPAAFGSLPGMLKMMQRPGETAHSGAGHHSCCPGKHAQLQPVLLVAATPLSMPCGNHLPCCMKRSPQNASSIPEVAGTARPMWQRANVMHVRPRPSMTNGSMARSNHNFLPDYFSRSTVLRI